jgi:hypothetical protein
LVTPPVEPPEEPVEPVEPLLPLDPPIPVLPVAPPPVCEPLPIPEPDVVVPPVEPVPPVAAPALEFRLASTFMKLRLETSALYVPVRKLLVHAAAPNDARGRPKPSPASISPPTTMLF